MPVGDRAVAAVVLVAVMALPQPGLAQEMACGESLPGNGTGYQPPSNPSSLPAITPRPGPEILSEPLTTSPQLENAGPWTAEPIMVSGTRAYRDGEFLYQDFLYDDTALTYSDEPERYAGNAADIVEVRLRPLEDALAIRITFNSMLEPDAVATTIALGDSGAPQDLPHDAGAVAPGEVFITAVGCTGDIVRAADGSVLDVDPVVTTDLERRQVDVRVPYTAFDPRGRTDLRVAAAVGLWDTTARRYLRPDPVLPAFFNVAFREYGEWTQNTWMDEQQNAALAAGDLSPLFATVDVTALEDGVDDDLVDQPGGVPSTGPMNRILVSRFEPVQGRGSDGAGGGILAEDGGRQSIMLLPNARGMSYFYHGLAAADVFEAWAHVAALYDLDPGYVVQSGSSMGGFGTYKLGVQFPDLFTAIFPNIGINTAALSVPPAVDLAGEGGDAWRMFASLRNVPVLATNGLNDPVVSYQNTSFSMRMLDELGYRYDYWWFAGVDGGGGHAEYRHHVPEEFARLMAEHGPTDRDPRRVTYVLNAVMDEPEYGLTADHAYWLAGLALRDETALFGTIDVISRGFPGGDSAPLPQLLDAGATQNGSLPYQRASREWGPFPEAEVADVLDITATNVAAVTIDVDRARVSCDATVTIDSDGPLEVTLVGDRCGVPEVTRHAGQTRIETAGAVSGLGIDQADTVVVARSDDYADALAGGPLAVHLGAPLLLSASDTLSAAASEEVGRLGATEAVLLGGEAALAPQVAADLEELGLTVRRVEGPNRFATAAAIAGELPSTDEVLVARGDGFADALSASALGSATAAPILLVEPDRLPTETAAALTDDLDVTVVGGTAAVSDAVAAEIDARTGTLRRLAGETRYGTSAAVADAAVAAGIAPSVTWVATGADVPDALVAGAAAGRDQGVLVLIDGTDLDGSPATRDWLSNHTEQIDHLRIAGGTAAISTTVEQVLEAMP